MHRPEPPVGLPSEEDTTDSDVGGAHVLAPPRGPDEILPAPRLWGNLQRKASLLASAKIIALLIFAIVVTSFCKRLPRKVLEEGLVQRKLAEGGLAGDTDDELDAILEQCLEMEEQSELSSSIIATPPSVQAPLEGLPAFVGEYVQSLTSKEPHVSERAASEWRWMPGGAPLGTHQSGGPQVEYEGLAVTGTLPELMHLDSEAWLDLIPSLEHEFVALGEAAGDDERRSSVGDDSQPSTSAFTSNGLAATIPPTGEPPSVQAQESFVGQGAEAGAGAISSKVSPPDRQEPSTSEILKGLLVGPTHEARGIESHPFVRLPQILPGAIRRQLDPALVTPGRARYGSKCLAEMRELFAKTALNAIDVEKLLTASESLISYVRYTMNHGRPTDTPGSAVYRFALYFLICDSLVCARELLGPAMAPQLWWGDFVKRINISYIPSEQRIKLVPAVSFNLKMLERLRKALELYKTGVRPPTPEVLELKRLIFLSPHTPEYFTRQTWSAWRIADRQFVKSSEKARDDQE